MADGGRKTARAQTSTEKRSGDNDSLHKSSNAAVERRRAALSSAQEAHNENGALAARTRRRITVRSKLGGSLKGVGDARCSATRLAQHERGEGKRWLEARLRFRAQLFEPV